MRKFAKNTLAAAASLAVLAAGVVSTPSLVSAWGNDGAARRSYTIDQINYGALGNKITLNSISNSTIGDEKNFVGAREDTGQNLGAENIWEGNQIHVEDGKDYLVRLYVHNNNPNGEAAIAKDVKVAFDIPEDSSTRIQVNGFITSSNAAPSKYWDYVDFVADQPFHLEYDWGSALLENNGIGQNGGVKLSDDIVKAATGGVLIGYNDLDGQVPGCYTYDNFVGIRVKAVYDKPVNQAEFTMAQDVRLAGETQWHDSITAQVGDKVEFQAEYTNISKVNTQRNVTFRSVLPKNMRYVAGTTKLYNHNHPNGAGIVEDTVTTTGINIGDYAPGANAYIRFTAVVVDNSLACGANSLFDWARGTADNKLVQDYSMVMVNKTCSNQVTPEGEKHTVTVNYVYEDGSEAAPTVKVELETGDPFVIPSPKIAGYTPNYSSITGQIGKYDLNYTVTYTKDQAQQPVDSQPETPVKPNPGTVDKMPTAGPMTTVGSVIGAGSIATALSYYVKSRRALRQ